MARILLIAALVLTSSGFARAATLLTHPFPGSLFASGTVYCSISNDATKPIQVTVDLLGSTGNPVNASTTVMVPAGETVNLNGADLSVFSPVRCRFTVPSKGKVRAAFTWYRGNSELPMIIPAQ